MRKVEQKRILDNLVTLAEMHTALPRLFNAGNIGGAAELLAGGQALTVHTGEYIEHVFGEGARTVKLLEAYHSLLYEANAGLIGANNGCAAVVKRLERQLSAIRQSVKTELEPDRIEVAFLPYKYAMSDALESIWLAAIADPVCDAHIVPIPYYDRQPNGELGEMHDETDLYPKELPLTSWRHYDIETRRPDIIFVHSPYDAGNYATSVHPNFYNERLRAFTDMLVYVPYFVCVNQTVYDHMCPNAGILYAHRVIVETEKVRDGYIRLLENYERQNNLKGLFGNIKEKFVALGSPKYDKVLSCVPQDFALPDNWRALIEKPDGSKKKVILYNTTLSSLLAFRENHLAKIRAVLEAFRKKEDVVLWWRPHPLAEATVRAMIPHMLDSYLNTVEKYRREGFGIYDGSQDLHRAIAHTDACYGDSSSVTSLYLRTGKPVLLQNEKITDYSYLDGIVTDNIYDDGKNYWFTAFHYNALFKVEKETRQIAYAGSFLNEKTGGSRLFTGIAAADGKLYFEPRSAGGIAVYDTASGTFSSITLKEHIKASAELYNPSQKFANSVFYGGRLFLFPLTYPAIVSYSPKTQSVEYHTGFIKAIEPYWAAKRQYYFIDLCVVGNTAFLTLANANAVLAFNMCTCAVTVYEVGDKGFGHSAACFDGKYLWLMPYDSGPVVRWEPRSAKWDSFSAFPKGYRGAYTGFSAAIFACGAVWAFPDRCNMVLKIDAASGQMEEADVFAPAYDKVINPPFKHFYRVLGKSGPITALASKNWQLVQYDCAAALYSAAALPPPSSYNVIREIQVQMFEASPEKSAHENGIIKEWDRFALDGFISYIQKPHGAHIGPPAGYTPAGPAIYGYCKSLL